MWLFWISYRSNLLLPPSLWQEEQFLLLFPPTWRCLIGQSSQLVAWDWWGLLMPPPSPLRFMCPLDWPSITGALLSGATERSYEQCDSLPRLWFHQWTPPTWLICGAIKGLDRIVRVGCGYFRKWCNFEGEKINQPESNDHKVNWPVCTTQQPFAWKELRQATADPRAHQYIKVCTDNQWMGISLRLY